MKELITYKGWTIRSHQDEYEYYQAEWEVFHAPSVKEAIAAIEKRLDVARAIQIDQELDKLEEEDEDTYMTFRVPD